MSNKIKNAIELALDNLNDESYFPLLALAKDKLEIDIQAQCKEKLLNWAASLLRHERGNPGIKEKILSGLDSATSYIMKKIQTFHPRRAKYFFNYVKDAYAKKLVNSYLNTPENKETLINEISAWSEQAVMNSILKKLNKSKTNQLLINQLLPPLESLIRNIDEPLLAENSILKLRNILGEHPKTRKILAQAIVSQEDFNDNLEKIFMKAPMSSIYDRIKEQLYSRKLSKIKKAQARAIYQYDGLIERSLPASVRGLHGLDKDTIKQIALKGDKSKEDELLNFEVASYARYNKDYAPGHTGASNRSSTPLTDIANYFATKHGLRRGKPESTWIMIFESTKGLNMTEIVDKSVGWTEFEFATPELSAKKFLGAVKLEVDEKRSNKNDIQLKAVNGFVAPRVHKGKYNKAGIEGDIANMLDMAKFYDKPKKYAQPNLDIKLPRKIEKHCQDRTLFQRFYDMLGLSSSRKRYMKQRAKQLEFVQTETPEARQKRLQQEKRDMVFITKKAQAKEREMAITGKSWLPSFLNKSLAAYVSPVSYKPTFDRAKARV